MNNWDIRPAIQVYASDMLPSYITDIVAIRIISEEIIQEPKTFIIGGQHLVVTNRDERISDEVVTLALTKLKAHIDTVHICTWASLKGDYCLDTEDGTWCDEYSATFHASRIDIKLLYFKA